MNKIYQRINWENYPDDTTPLSAQNLNRLDVAADELDNRLIALDTAKMDKITAATMVKDIAYDETDGSFTVTYLDGSSYTLDTKLEKLAVNFTYDPAAEQLVILLEDGTTQNVDLSSLVTEHEFQDTDTIGFSVDDTGGIRAQVRDGSITEAKLRPDYLSDIRVEGAKAQAAAEAVLECAAEAEVSAAEAESYAKGGTGTRENEDTDNAGYYSRLARAEADRATAEADRAAAEILDRVMTTETAGIGRPDGVTITVDGEGVLTASVAGKTSDLENDSGFAAAAELTQEEYDALPEEKLSDGKLYLIRDAGGENGQLVRNGVNYGADRDLRELLGAADISAVGDGTVTGALIAQGIEITNVQNGLTEKIQTEINNYMNFHPIDCSWYELVPVKYNYPDTSKTSWSVDQYSKFFVSTDGNFIAYLSIIIGKGVTNINAYAKDFEMSYEFEPDSIQIKYASYWINGSGYSIKDGMLADALPTKFGSVSFPSKNKISIKISVPNVPNGSNAYFQWGGTMFYIKK